MSLSSAQLDPPGIALRLRLRNALRKFGVIRDPGSWIDSDHRILLCAYPRGARDLRSLEQRGIRLLVNLDERPHSPEQLICYHLTECHLPVRDFTAPSAQQLTIAVAAVASSIARGDRVAIHCGAGLGRSGTVAACYLVELGREWPTAIRDIRQLRPGAIETKAQVAAVAAFAERRMVPARDGA
ncbi:MAG: dual specificity protein phosphatase family protein [Gemmatimonadota bacterium]